MIKDFKTYIREGRMGRLVHSENGIVRKEDGIVVRIDDKRYFIFKHDDIEVKDLSSEFSKYTTEFGDVYEFEDKVKDEYVFLLYDGEYREGGYFSRLFVSKDNLENTTLMTYVNTFYKLELLNPEQYNGNVSVYVDIDREGYGLLNIDDSYYYIFDDYDKAYRVACEQEYDTCNNTETKDLFERHNYQGKNETQFERCIRTCGDKWFDYDGLLRWYTKYQQEIIENMDDEEKIDELIRHNVVVEHDDFFETDDYGDIDISSPKFDPSDYDEELAQEYTKYCDADYSLLSNLISELGKETITSVIDEEGLISYEELAQAIVDCDGVSATLSEDDTELSCDYNNKTYYIYKCS